MVTPIDVQSLVDGLTGEVRVAAQNALDIAVAEESPQLLQAIANVLPLSASLPGTPIFFSGPGNVEAAKACQAYLATQGQDSYLFSNTVAGEYYLGNVYGNPVFTSEGASSISALVSSMLADQAEVPVIAFTNGSNASTMWMQYELPTLLSNSTPINGFSSAEIAAVYAAGGASGVNVLVGASGAAACYPSDFEDPTGLAPVTPPGVVVPASSTDPSWLAVALATIAAVGGTALVAGVLVAAAPETAVAAVVVGIGAILAAAPAAASGEDPYSLALAANNTQAFASSTDLAYVLAKSSGISQADLDAAFGVGYTLANLTQEVSGQTNLFSSFSDPNGNPTSLQLVWDPTGTFIETIVGNSLDPSGSNLTTFTRTLNPDGTLADQRDLVHAVTDGVVGVVESVSETIANGATSIASYVYSTVRPWSGASSFFFSDPISPLVVDLSGNGIKTSSSSGSLAFFDLQGTGHAVQTGWLTAGADEGFLALPNADGSITSISNLFGTDGSTPDGFTALAKLDSNKDGVIDANDASFANLVVWIDANGDGVEEPGETETLAQAGITSISLSKTSVSSSSPSYSNNGNTIRQVSSVIMADGSTREIGDVWFATNPTSSRWAYVAPSSQDAALPDIAGSGSLDSLQQSYAKEPTLEAMALSLAKNAASMSWSQFDAAAQNLIYEWAGVSSVPVGSRGSYVDAQHLGVLEAIYGEPFTQTGFYTVSSYGVGPGEDAGPQLETLYRSIVGPWTAAIAVQLEASGDLVGAGWLSQIAGLGYDTVDDALSYSPAATFDSLSNAGLVGPAINAAFATGASGQPQFDPAFEAQVIAWLARQPSDYVPIALPQPSGGVTFSNGSLDVGSLEVFAPGESFASTYTYNNDLYVVPQDVGSITIDPPHQGSFRVLDLPDVASTDVTLIGSYLGGSSAVGIEENATGAVIDLLSEITGNDNVSVQSVAFSDGVVWTLGQIEAYFQANPLVFSMPNASGVVTGWLGPSVIEGTSGNQTLQGSGTSNLFVSGVGNDTEMGSFSGPDTFLYASGDGDDVISETPKTGFADTLDFTTLKPSQVSFSMSGSSLVATDATTGDTVTVQLEFAQGTNPSAAAEDGYGVESFAFSDGTVLDRSQVLHEIVPTTLVDYTGQAGSAFLASGPSIISATNGGVKLYGSSYNDVLVAGPGDTLEGGQGSDVYQYAEGDGAVTVIDDNSPDPADVDTLSLGSGITPSMVSETVSGGVVSLQIADGQADDVVALTGWDPYTLNPTANDAVDFVGGQTLTEAQIDAQLIVQEEAKPSGYVYGDFRSNVIDPSPGATGLTLEGGDGADTYLLDPGDGQDTVSDTTDPVGYQVVFDPNAASPVLPSNVTFTQSGMNLLVHYGTSDILTLTGWLQETGHSYPDLVPDTLTFSNGVTLTEAQVEADSMTGSPSNPTVNGTAGNDVITAGTGNESLSGGAGNDTYVFRPGDGATSVYDTSNTSGDEIEFDPSSPIAVTASSVSFTQSYTSLVLYYGSGGTITLQNWIPTTSSQANATANDEIVFTDGTTLTAAQAIVLSQTGTTGAQTIFATYAGSTLVAGSGNDILVGEAGNDTLHGGSGADTLEGGAGNDTYVFGPGDGVQSVDDLSNTSGDTIEFDPASSTPILASNVAVSQSGQNVVLAYGSSSIILEDWLAQTAAEVNATAADHVVFTDGSSLTAAQVVAESLVGTTGTQTITALYGGSTLTAGTGTDTLYGEAGNDTLVAGAGVDLLEGGAGNDTYVLATGDGATTINDTLNTSGDLIEFSPSSSSAITAANVGVTQSGTNVVLRYGSSTVTLDGWLFEIASQVNATAADVVEFTDGSTLTAAQVVAKSFTGTTGAQTIDALYSGSTLTAGTGTDTLVGGAGNDVLVAGIGTDLLEGGAGNDTYVLASGDGPSTISDTTNTTGDAIEFSPSSSAAVTASTISVTQSGLNLVVGYGGSSTVTLDNWLAETASQANATANDVVTFTDGSTATAAQVVALSQRGTTGTQSIYAAYTGSTLTAGTGTDTLYGEAGNDTLVAGSGTDLLEGGGGNDTYVLAAGDGPATVYDLSNATGDTIEFSPASSSAITDSNVTVSQSGLNLVLGYGSGSVTLDDWLAETSAEANATANDTIVFTDGSSRTAAQVVAQSFVGTTGTQTISATYSGSTIVAGTGTDTLYGEAGNDVLVAGAGADLLEGGAGNDTYVFQTGDGAATVSDTSNASGDEIEFSPSSSSAVTASTIAVSQSGLNLLVKYGSSSIVLDNWLAETASQANATANDQVVFTDGSTLTAAQLVALSQTGTTGTQTIYASYGGSTLTAGTGADSLYGEAGNDTLIAGTGGDYLAGGAGNDTYVLRVGDGADTINDATNATGDVVRFDPSQPNKVTAANVTFTQSGSNLLLHYGTSDVATLDGWLFPTAASVSATANDEIVFTDGSTLTRAQAAAASLTGTTGNQTITAEYTGGVLTPGTGNDTLVGEAGNDTLYGGPGANLLEGGAGNDTYVFDPGQGASTVSDSANTTGDQVVFDPKASTPILESNTTITQSGSNLVLRYGSSSTVTLDNWLFETAAQATTYAPIAKDTVTFGDGTVLTQAQVEAASMIGTSGADTINGTAGADVLQGGPGNDSINGGGGNDTFVFNPGDGLDTWSEAGAGQDTIDFGSGITFGGLTVTQSGSSFVVKTGTGTDQVTLSGAISPTTVTPFAGATFDFASDGSSHPFEDLFALSLNGSAGSKSIEGDTVANTIVGGPGDLLTAGSGATTFMFNSPYGKETINSFAPVAVGSTAADVINLSSSIFASYAALQSAGAITQSGANTLITKGSSDVLTLAGVTASKLSAANFAFH